MFGDNNDINIRILNKLADAVVITDNNAKIVFWNKKAEEIFGYNKEEIIGKNALDLVSKSLRGDIQKIMNKFKDKSGGPFVNKTVEIIGVKKSREEFNIEMSTSTIILKGKILGIVIVRDCSEKKRIEEKITNEAIDWENTFNAINDLISIHDKEFTILKVNKAFAEKFNKKPEEFIGLKCYEVMHKLKCPWALCPFEKSKITKKPALVRNFEPNLNMFLEISTFPIFKDKVIEKYIHIVRNISEYKKNEENLLNRSKELEKLNEFFINRELRMIELKDEVNGLLKQQGKDVKYHLEIKKNEK